MLQKRQTELCAPHDPPHPLGSKAVWMLTFFSVWMKLNFRKKITYIIFSLLYRRGNILYFACSCIEGNILGAISFLKMVKKDADWQRKKKFYILIYITLFSSSSTNSIIGWISMDTLRFTNHLLKHSYRLKMVFYSAGKEINSRDSIKIRWIRFHCWCLFILMLRSQNLAGSKALRQTSLKPSNKPVQLTNALHNSDQRCCKMQ